MENKNNIQEAEVKAIYVKKSIPGYYVGFPEEMKAEDWGEMLGYTYEDFLDNKWVLLSQDRINFHESNPDACIKEVFEMKLNERDEHVRDINDAKSEKIRDIDIYDNSESVNSFTINNEITAWFTPSERVNYKNSIESAKLLEVKELSLFINGTLMTIPTEVAERLLATIQLYADTCYITTQQHKNIVEAMTEIEDVDNYDYTVGYPERLNFTI